MTSTWLTWELKHLEVRLRFKWELLKIKVCGCHFWENWNKVIGILNEAFIIYIQRHFRNRQCRQINNQPVTNDYWIILEFRDCCFSARFRLEVESCFKIWSDFRYHRSIKTYILTFYCIFSAMSVEPLEWRKVEFESRIRVGLKVW